MPNETNDPPILKGMPSPEERPDLYDDDDSMSVDAGARSQVAIPAYLAARIAKREGKPYEGPVIGAPPPAPPADPVQTAVAMRHAGDLPGAIRFLYAELGENLSNPRIYITLATMLSENEEFDRAERVFQRAFAAGLEDEMLRLNYATFLAASGRAGQQIDEFRGFGSKMIVALGAAARDQSAWALRDTFGRWAAAECNLARLRLAEGNIDAARDLAEKWLVVEDIWHSAHEIVEGCIAEGEELVEFARLHEAQRASPRMVAALFDEAQATDPLRALAIVAASTAYLPWRWIEGVDGFERELRTATITAMFSWRLDTAPDDHLALQLLLDGPTAG